MAPNRHLWIAGIRQSSHQLQILLLIARRPPPPPYTLGFASKSFFSLPSGRIRYFGFLGELLSYFPLLYHPHPPHPPLIDDSVFICNQGGGQGENAVVNVFHHRCRCICCSSSPLSGGMIWASVFLPPATPL